MIVFASDCLVKASPRKVRNGNEAVRLAEQMTTILLKPGQTPVSAVDRATMLDTLAAAYAEAGRFDDAIAASRRSLEAAAATENTELIQELTQRFDLYTRHQPYRFE